MRNFFALLFLFFTVPILAQSKENERFVFGFFAGLETQSLGVQPLDTREPEKAAVQSGRLGMGTSVGILTRKKIWRGLFFQPALAMSYAKNQINFRSEGIRTFRFLDAELPVHFVATNWRRNDFPLRGCIIFGGRMGWNFAANPSNLLKITQERFALDLGLGAEIKVGRWRLQPAFVYSHGLNNLHRIDDAQYDEVVGKMVRDKLSLRISVWNIGK
ncbi:MAG: hypothetical protein Q7T20_06470 [Saprospiraceae bacterium]|nr:hypothetical protein [Saprospiraceae bacterium]